MNETMYARPRFKVGSFQKHVKCFMKKATKMKGSHRWIPTLKKIGKNYMKMSNSKMCKHDGTNLLLLPFQWLSVCAPKFRLQFLHQNHIHTSSWPWHPQSLPSKLAPASSSVPSLAHTWNSSGSVIMEESQFTIFSHYIQSQM